MEEKDKDSTSFDGSTCTLTLESYEVCLKRKKDTSIVDKRRLKCCKSTEKIKPSSFKGKCSKSCTKKSRKTNSNRSQTSDKPQTLCESSSCRQKKSKTKPTGEMPLFAQLKTKIKKTSRKFQSTLPFFKKTTRRTMARVKSYVGSKPKRALGFKCDLKKCSSTLTECSAGACRKKNMIFGEPIQPCSSKITDSSASDTSTEPSTSENRF